MKTKNVLTNKNAFIESVVMKDAYSLQPIQS